jgi:hypothetical protein
MKPPTLRGEAPPSAERAYTQISTENAAVIFLPDPIM